MRFLGKSQSDPAQRRVSTGSSPGQHYRGLADRTRIGGNQSRFPWEGFLGGVATATLLGTALWWATPFTPWQAAGMSFAITLMGFAGGLVMSAIKRDRGVKDYGTLIKGHGGVMDRIDSLCFSAPVFFHLTRYFFT